MAAIFLQPLSLQPLEGNEQNDGKLHVRESATKQSAVLQVFFVQPDLDRACSEKREEKLPLGHLCKPVIFAINEGVIEGVDTNGEQTNDHGY